MDAPQTAGRFVSLDTLVPYLTDAQILHAADLTDDPAFRVEDRTRRNRNFKVLRSRGPKLMVKQAGSPDPESTATLRTEAMLLEAVANDDHFKSLRWFSPVLVHHDAPNNVLVTELVHPSTSLTKFHLSGGKIEFPIEMASTCGRVLANFHTSMSQGVRRGFADFLKPMVPFILKAQDMWNKNLEASGEAGTIFVKELQKTALYENIQTVKDSISSSKEVMHGDVRWDNFLLTYGSAPGENMNIRLIDWELVSIGDPAWDVTAYLVEYHRFWLSSANMLSPDADDPSTAKGAFEFSTVHPAANAFLTAYIRRRGLKPAQATALRQRIGLYLPYAMVLISFESTQRQSKLPLGAKMGLNLAVRALKEPAACLQEWYGVQA